MLLRPLLRWWPSSLRQRLRSSALPSPRPRCPSAPGSPPLPLLTASGEAGDANPLDQLRDAQARRVGDGMAEHWSTFLAIEAVTAEVLEILGDDAVVPETMRSLLAHSRSELSALHQRARQLVGLDPLPVIDETFAEKLRSTIWTRLYLFG